MKCELVVDFSFSFLLDKTLRPVLQVVPESFLVTRRIFRNSSLLRVFLACSFVLYLGAVCLMGSSVTHE